MPVDAYIVKSTAGNWFGYYVDKETAYAAKRRIAKQGDADGIRWSSLKVIPVHYTHKGHEEVNHGQVS